MAVDNDLSKLRIDKERMSKRQRKKRRHIFLSVAFLLIFLLVTLYVKGVLKPAVEVQVTTVQIIYPAQTFTLLNASGYVVAQRKAAVASKVTGRLVFLGVEEGSRVRFAVEYEGEKISIGRVFELDPHSFYTVLTQEHREGIKKTFASIEGYLRTSQEGLNDDSLSQLGEILVELGEIENPPPTFMPEERERIAAQALKYRKRLIYSIGISSMFDFLSQL